MAVIVTFIGEVTDLVKAKMLKVPEVSPTFIIMLRCNPIAPTGVADNNIIWPSEGAGPLKVTVPTEGAPGIIEDGDMVNIDTARG